jgi:hypothetical protein
MICRHVSLGVRIGCLERIKVADGDLLWHLVDDFLTLAWHISSVTYE